MLILRNPVSPVATKANPENNKMDKIEQFQRVNIHALAEAKIAEVYSENSEFVILNALLAKNPDGSWTSEVLDNWVMQVSNILVNVAEKVAILISEYNTEYSFRLMYEYHQYAALRDKNGASDSEKFSKGMSSEYRIAELVASEVADRLKAREKAAYNLLSISQTRLSNLRQERIYTKHQQG
jgi:hypothetical protein